MKPIIRAPNAVLTSPAKTVTNFDKRLKALVEEMKETLIATKNPKGVGLAAPQIGQPWRIFVTRPTEKSAVRAFINPEIIKSSSATFIGVKEKDNRLEGCLSIPKIWGKVERVPRVTLNFQDANGKSFREEFSGLMAHIVQHETDHTNGILYTQRVLEQKGKLYEETKDKEGKEILEEIKI